MFRVIAIAAAIAVTTTAAGAQATGAYKSTVKPPTQASAIARRHKSAKRVESQEAPQKEAKISEETARAAALKEVPNGTVKSSKLERERGKLIYSYDISVPGKPGVEEVNISAIDGSLVGKAHESARTERKEAAKEAKDKNAAKK